jgi:hypothetical protein
LQPTSWAGDAVTKKRDLSKAVQLIKRQPCQWQGFYAVSKGNIGDALPLGERLAQRLVRAQNPRIRKDW